MNMLRALPSCERGSAAAEMALCLPLLLIIMMGTVELGNYFLDEHVLVKAVRDGARFASRQSFTAFDCSSGTADQDAVVTPTENLVRTGSPSGGTDRLPGWSGATFSVTVACHTQVVSGQDSSGKPVSQTMSGIYSGYSTGAPVVTVTASVPYSAVLGAFGFTGLGYSLNASEQAAVAGI